MSGTVARASAGRRLRASLVVGALYDLVFAAILLAAPRAGSIALRIPMPDQQVYLRFTGVFLAALAMFYLLPALHPGRYLGNVVVAVGARTAGAAFLVTAATVFDQPPALLALGAGDAIFALAHAVFLVQAEGGGLLRHYLKGGGA